jgi:hypothetical protein
MTCLTQILNKLFRLVPRYQLVLLVALSLQYPAGAQATKKTPSPESADAAATVKNAASQGFQLSASTNVSDQVSVEAVMLPASVSKKIFGKEVGNNYAVVELIITNRSTEAAVLVHSIFIDDSQWLLSGGSPFEVNLLCPESDGSDENATLRAPANATDQKEGKTQVGRKKCGVRGNTLPLSQTQTQPNQIASAETRLVRGELLDTQPWTTRNWIIRALQVTGSIASGFTFATSSQSWIRGIGAFNGQGVPGAQTFWPDATVGQMNRISDLGFQVNKVIAKQNSDAIVAFFPIDRFITPGLKNLFIKSPAVFFAPYVMMFDSEVNGSEKGKSGKNGSQNNTLSAYVKKLFTDDELTKLNQHLYEVTSGGCLPPPDNNADLKQACEIADLINHLSLNTVRVLVGGTMTVDVDTVPANITSVDVDIPADKTSSSMWQTAATLTGVIRGSFLSNGTPVIVGSDDLGIKIAAVADGSTDTALHFKITLSKALPTTQTKLTFQVKKTKSGTSVQSANYDYPLTASASTDKTAAPKTNSDVSPGPEKSKSAEPAQPKTKDKNN